MGFGAISGNSTPMSASAIRDALESLTGVNRLDASAIDNLPSGGNPSAWQIKTGNYTAINGDRLWFDINSITTLQLPSNPNSGDTIAFQRLENTANNLIINTQGKPINSQTGKDGIFSPTNIGVYEELTFVNNTIGWLGKFDRLTYQTNISNTTGFTNSTLLLRFDGTNGSTTIVDSSANNLTVGVVGSASLSSNQSKFGSTSLFLPGGVSYCQVADTPTLEFLNNDFTIEWWQNLTTSSYILGKGNAQTVVGSSFAAILGSPMSFYCDGSSVYSLPTTAPTPGSMQHVAITRQGGVLRFFVGGVMTGTVTIPVSASINNTPNPLQFGGYATVGSSSGYVDELAIDIGVCRYSTNFTPPTATRAS
jgi:Concanavalin A-like lectin/glucanases superfamily